MHTTAVRFAVKHKFRLGRFGEGHGAKTGLYFLTDGHGNVGEISNTPTATSAIAMMRKQLRFDSRKYRAA